MGKWGTEWTIAKAHNKMLSCALLVIGLEKWVMSLVSPAPRRLLFPLPRCDADAIASAKRISAFLNANFLRTSKKMSASFLRHVETYSKTLGVVCCTAVLLSFDGLAGGLFPYPKRGERALATTK